MAIGNFPPCLAVTLTHEGGWADHPKDPGGATMKGVTLATYRRYKPKATKEDLRRISDAELKTIYRDGYWRPLNGELLPHGVDLATFDFGVNSGPSRAAKYLQAVVGAKQDGQIGPETLKKVVVEDGKRVIQKLCAKRMTFLSGLSTFTTFGKGWTRRVADVEARAVSMWLAKGRKPDGRVQAELIEEANKAGNKAGAQSKSAGGVTAGGGVASAGDAFISGEPNWLFVAGIVLAAGAVVFYLVAKSRRNREREKAYLAVAKGR